MSYGEGNWPESLPLVIEEFSDVFDPMERYEMLYECASECDHLSEGLWCEETRVHGCQSEAHSICWLNDDGIF